MNSIYDEIGVTAVINASGSMTYLGGSLMAPETLAAMNRAAGQFVRMDELMTWGGAQIARLTGAEAGHVTTGSAGGLLLGTAACLTGLDRQKMSQLPDTTGMKREMVVQKRHRISFDHACRTAGAKLVEAGDGSGTTAAQLQEAITDRTAAVLYVELYPQPVVPLEEVAAIAHARGVPVMVDAAAELPPSANLRAFLERGADLVIFSGGKDIAGPNDTGILCGRRDLVQAAAMQAFPNAGIGRPCKVSKEQIVGLVYALRRWAALDHDARIAAWRGMAEQLCAGLQGLEGVRAEVALATSGARPLVVPKARVTVEERIARVGQVEQALMQGKPAIAISTEPAMRALWLNPQHLEPEQVEVVVRRVREVLSV
ncbi:MAG: Aminotransferase class V-fold PLP-dependent enzyme [Actinomycetota bacterium]|nr:Aminotransferase class V-fold PLP-dependent enzyme [Actinomycetota bacterium]